jgi:hypothetical protein
MDNGVDEDLIEATIRRVAEAKAAQAPVGADAPDEDVTGAPEALGTVDEDAIAATIRRVAEATAAQPAPAEDARGQDEDPIEATIRRVEAERAARAFAAESEAGAPALDDVVDEAIAHAEFAVLPEADERIEYPARPLHLVETAQNAGADDEFEDQTSNSDDEADARDGAGGYRRPRLIDGEPLAASIADGVDIARLDAELASANRRIDDLAGRVDALMAMLERIVRDGTSAANESVRARPVAVPSPAPSARDDDWNDAPQLPRIPMGGPPRPAIVRDPSPMTATAEHLVEIAPESAAAAPAAREAAPPPKRGFDLLPKTYRITVEDKRRGVDLVPLHRALLAMDGVKDMSLLSYSNGVAIVSVETQNGIEPDALNKAVSRAMAREVKVEVHNETTMVVKLAED